MTLGEASGFVNRRLWVRLPPPAPLIHRPNPKFNRRRLSTFDRVGDHLSRSPRVNRRWTCCPMNEGTHPRPALKRSAWEGGRSLKAVQFKRLACDAPHCRGPSTPQRVGVLPSARTAMGSAGQSRCDFGSAPRMSRSKTGSICKITSYLDYHCEIVPPWSDSRLADDRSSTENGFDELEPVISRFEDRWSSRDSGLDKRCR